MCLYGLTQGTHGVKSTAVILSTCFKSAGCQPEMSSKPNLIDIMPYFFGKSAQTSASIKLSSMTIEPGGSDNSFPMLEIGAQEIGAHPF